MPAQQFAQVWIQQQRVNAEELTSARGAPDSAQVHAAVDRVVDLYEAYYRARAQAAAVDPIQFLCAPWATPLERATHWIGGWRPITLIHLLYSESGIRFEAQLQDILLGVHSGDLGDLSPGQLARIDEVQRRTIGEEDEIGDEMVALQLDLADPSSPAESDFVEKAGRLKDIIGKADGLRMRTLRDVVDILAPVQAASLLVAAAELEIGFREVGERLESRRDGQ